VSGIVFQYLLQKCYCVGRVAIADKRLRASALDIGWRGQDPLDEGAHLAFRLRADEFIHQFPVYDCLHCRDTPDTEIRGELLILVGVDLGEREASRILGRQFLQNGRERLAWAAPGGPEVDDDRRAL
jgi:hypothetical protein